MCNSGIFVSDSNNDKNKRFEQITFSVGVFLDVEVFSLFSALTAAETTEGLTSSTKR